MVSLIARRRSERSSFERVWLGRLIILGCAMSSMPLHGAQTYYVDALLGHDSNGDGSSSKPFATIQKAVDQLDEAGDHVKVIGGRHRDPASGQWTERVYRESVRIRDLTGRADRPIIIEGEFGGNFDNDSFDGTYTNYESRRNDRSNWGTIVDPGIPLTGWQRAPGNLGQAGVYQIAGFSHCHKSLSLSVNDFALTRLMPSQIDRGPGKTLLMTAADHEITLYDWADERVLFWDGIEALYGCSDTSNVLYLRFRDGRDPDSEDVTIDWRGGIKIENCRHVIVRGFLVRGAYSGIWLYHDSDDNVVERNFITGSSHGIMLQGEAADPPITPDRNRIRDNEITLEYYGVQGNDFDTGAWSGSMHHLRPGGLFYRYAVRHNIWYNGGGKNRVAYQWLWSINAINEGERNEYSGNHLFNTIRGIISNSGGSKSTTAGRANYSRFGHHRKIYNNTIHNMSGIGIQISDSGFNNEIYDNLLYDCNLSFRIHDPTVGPLFVYRNRSVSFVDGAEHVYLWYASNYSGLSSFIYPRMYFYHNSFSGGKYAFSTSQPPDERLNNLYVVNNILGSLHPLNAPAGTDLGDCRFEHNLMREELRDGLASAGRGNLVSRLVWPTYADELPVSRSELPNLDVVDARVTDGQTIPALDLSSAYRGFRLPWSGYASYQASKGVGAHPESGYTTASKPVQTADADGLLLHWTLQRDGGSQAGDRIVREQRQGHYHGELINGAEWTSGPIQFLRFRQNNDNAQVKIDAEPLTSLSSEATFVFRTHAGTERPSIEHPVVTALSVTSQDQKGYPEAPRSAVRISFELVPRDRIMLVALVGNCAGRGSDRITYTFHQADYVNRWNYWAITKDRLGLQIYRNGVLVANAAGENDCPINSEDLVGMAIGNIHGWHQNQFDGVINDLRIYNKALSSTEIRRLTLGLAR